MDGAYLLYSLPHRRRRSCSGRRTDCRHFIERIVRFSAKGLVASQNGRKIFSQTAEFYIATDGSTLFLAKIMFGRQVIYGDTTSSFGPAKLCPGPQTPKIHDFRERLLATFRKDRQFAGPHGITKAMSARLPTGFICKAEAALMVSRKE